MCSGPMRRSLAVEVDRVALADVGRADAEARVLRVEQLEIDQPLERRPQRRRVVEAERAFRAPGLQPGRRHARGVEAVDAGGDAGERAPLVEDAAGEIAVEQRLAGDALGDQLPELAQPLDPPLRRIAGDDGAVDRTDGDAGDPVRQVAPLRQGLVDAGLIGAERAAALEHQSDLGAVRGQGLSVPGAFCPPRPAPRPCRSPGRPALFAGAGCRLDPSWPEHLPVGVADSLARLLQPANGCSRQITAGPRR